MISRSSRNNGIDKLIYLMKSRKNARTDNINILYPLTTKVENYKDFKTLSTAKYALKRDMRMKMMFHWQ